MLEKVNDFCKKMIILNTDNFTASSKFLVLLLTHLENIKLQIVRIPRSPQYGMIRCLGPELHLAQTLMGISGCLTDGLGKQLIIHEMGAGTGGQESSVLHQLHSP